MPAPPLPASARYFNPGTTRVYFVAEIADKTNPTRAELDAGVDLSGEVSEVDGWMISSEFIDTPDLASRFTSKIPGRMEAEDSSITFYADIGGVDVRTVLSRDTSGFIVWMDGGDEPGHTMDVYPVRVASLGKSRSAADDPATIEIQFSVTAEPVEDLPVPSA